MAEAAVAYEGDLRAAEIESIRLAAKGRMIAISVFALFAVVSLSGALLLN
jgi:hypothetical protein